MDGMVRLAAIGLRPADLLRACGQPTREVSHDFVLAGIGQSETVNASLACHGDLEKVVRVEVQQTPLDGAMAALTLGIYTPRTARVYCNL